MMQRANRCLPNEGFKLKIFADLKTANRDILPLEVFLKMLAHTKLPHNKRLIHDFSHTRSYCDLQMKFESRHTAIHPMEVICYSMMTDDIRSISAALLDSAKQFAEDKLSSQCASEAKETLDPASAAFWENMKKVMHSMWYANTYHDLTLNLKSTDGIDRDFVNINHSSSKETGFYLNLSNAYLCRANLRGVHLANANLKGIYLNRADLSGAFLQSVNLSHAELRYSHLCAVNLQFADLSNVEWYGADLTGADLTGANLAGVSFKGVIIKYANLSQCKMLLPSAFESKNAFDEALTGMISVIEDHQDAGKLREVLVADIIDTLQNSRMSLDKKLLLVETAFSHDVFTHKKAPLVQNSVKYITSFLSSTTHFLTTSQRKLDKFTQTIQLELAGKLAVSVKNPIKSIG